MEHQIETRWQQSNTNNHCWQKNRIQTLIVCFSVRISDGLRSSVLVRVINHHHTRALLTNRSTAGRSDGSSTCVIGVLCSCLICTLEKNKRCSWVHNRVNTWRIIKKLEWPCRPMYWSSDRAQHTELESWVGASLYHDTSTAVAFRERKTGQSRVGLLGKQDLVKLSQCYGKSG